MKDLILALLLTVMLGGVAQSQSLSVSPTSFRFWGKTPNTALADLKYKDVSVVFIMPLVTRYKDIKGNKYSGLFGGVFYSPLKLKIKNLSTIVGGGAILPKYPTKNGTNFNFRIQFSYQIRRVSIEYSHISNGTGIIGIRGVTNVGLDNVSLRFHL